MFARRVVLATLVYCAVPASAWAQSTLIDEFLTVLGSGNPSAADHCLISRPLTPFQGTFEAGARLNHASLGGGWFNVSVSTVAVSAGYSITDNIEAGFETALAIDPAADWAQVLGFRLLGTVYSSETADIGLSVVLPVFFNDGDAINVVSGGIPMRFILSPYFAILTGHNMFSLAVGSFGYFLINANVALAFQPTEYLGLRIDTQLFRLGVEATSGSFNDWFPLGFTVLGTFETVDLYASLTIPHLPAGTDVVSVNGGLTVRF